MIDIHTHILPGLDDGARDMEDSLSMAALALKSGVHTLVATSHANEGTEKHTIFILTLIKKKKSIRVFMILVDFLLDKI